MWLRAASVFAALGIVAIVITEVVRSIVDRHRVRTQGHGGTQDIAICGMLVMAFCAVSCIVCLLIWLVRR
jgi:drug/metabolite transporter superfamily protein YnfA